MTPLPFSGLSLIFHVGIIALSSIAGLLGFTRKRKKGFETEGFVAQVSTYTNPLVSLAILIAIGLVSISFVATALKTGFTVGADEPQREFVAELID
jgi:hypothetical protein